jgi:c-di-GMP-binding flagellar brake protein YcgR
VRRLREHQLVTLELDRPNASIECLVLAVEGSEATLTFVHPGDAGRLPATDKDAYLTFVHRSQLVTLKGTGRRRDDEEACFKVTDRVMVPQRRRYARVDVELPLTIGSLGTRTRDLSADGLLADLLLPDEPETVRIRLPLPDGKPPIECDARVVRRVDGGTGLRYDGISSEDRDRLKQFVAARKRELLARVRDGDQG